jgi:hypothetical protein
MSSFPSFEPNLLLANTHVQTVLGSWLRGRLGRVRVRRRVVTLPDGDRLLLHDSQPPGEDRPRRVAVLLHGLGGSYASGYMERTTARLLRRGWRVVRLDARGCGAGLPLARRPAHSGLTADVRAALAAIRHEDPSARLSLVGFSLGGNTALKLAGEAAAEPIAGLERVAAVAPPLDLERCAALIALPKNRVYELYFLRALLANVRRRREHFPELHSVAFPRRMTLRRFDDLYTAPLWDFADALDYYRRCSSAPLVGRIALPALILTARDDPFIAVEPFEALPRAPHREVVIVPRGGHLGFLAWNGQAFVRWAEEFLVDWLERDGRPDGDAGQLSGRERIGNEPWRLR